MTTGCHEALLYGSDEALLAVAVPFLRDGIAKADPTLLVLDGRDQRLVLDALGEDHGVTIAQPDEKARPLDVLRERWAVYERTAPDRQIRVVGRMSDRPSPAWARYEAWIDQLYVRLPVWTVCAYDTRSTPPEVLADVEATHRHVRDDAHLQGRLNERYLTPERALARLGQAELGRLRAMPAVVSMRDASPEMVRKMVHQLADDAHLEWDDVNALALSARAVIAHVQHLGGHTAEVWIDQQLTVLLSVDEPGDLDPFAGLLGHDGPDVRPGELALGLIYGAIDDVAVWRDDRLRIRLSQPLSRARRRPRDGDDSRVVSDGHRRIP
jgi:hypothetical protein